VPTHEQAVQHIMQLNQRVAGLQHAGKIEEGTALADQAFFAALESLPEGHALRAQAARNRGIMQSMSGNMDEAMKTFIVAIDCYAKSVEAAKRLREELEAAGDLQAAAAIAKEQALLTEAHRQLRTNVFGER